MTPPPEPGDFFPLESVSSQILRELKAIADQGHQLKEIAEQGRDNAEGLRMLNVHLGVEGVHGRIPAMEIRLDRVDIRIDKLEARAVVAEGLAQQEKGKDTLRATFLTLLGGSASGAAITIAWHYLQRVGH